MSKQRDYVDAQVSKAGAVVGKVLRDIKSKAYKSYRKRAGGSITKGELLEQIQFEKSCLVEVVAEKGDRIELPTEHIKE